MCEIVHYKFVHLHKKLKRANVKKEQKYTNIILKHWSARLHPPQ